MSTNSSWIPKEDPQTLLSERCWLQGLFVSAAAYGITVSLYVLCFSFLLQEKYRAEFKHRLSMLVYITVLFLLGTLFIFTLDAYTQMAFIDQRNFSGGPSKYEQVVFAVPVDTCSNITFVLTNWLCDALLVWRFKIIYRRCRVPLWLVMSFPYLMLAGSVALGTAFLLEVSTTTQYFPRSVNFTEPYLGLSLALNIILSFAIVLRLLTFKYRTAAVLGSKHGTQYTSIATMTIESAALYSTVSITFLILFKMNRPVSQVFLQSLSQFQTIATLLILFRIVQGRAWKEDTATIVMTSQRWLPKAAHLDLGKIRIVPPNVSITLANSERAHEGGDGEF